MSLQTNVSEKAALIWAIADKLTGVFKPHEYGEVILPLTVIRRFDCILADTKDKVLETVRTSRNIVMLDWLLQDASGYTFYNTSWYTFESLAADFVTISGLLQLAEDKGLLKASPATICPTPLGRRFLNDLQEIFLPD